MSVRTLAVALAFCFALGVRLRADEPRFFPRDVQYLPPASSAASLTSVSDEAEPVEIDVTAEEPEHPAVGPDVRALQLTFVVHDGEDHQLDVVCLDRGTFRLSVDMSNLDGERYVVIEGELAPLDGAERVVLSFELSIDAADLVEGGEVSFSAEGGTIVALGEQASLATFPGPSVTVTLSAIDQ